MFPLSVIDFTEPETTKTSHAEITLKSATLPRRKPTKMEIQVEVKSKVSKRFVDLTTSKASHSLEGDLLKLQLK